MYKDFGRTTVHINRYHITNFGLGFDFYQLNDVKTNTLEASVVQFSLLFFNVTLTRWHRWI